MNTEKNLEKALSVLDPIAILEKDDFNRNIVEKNKKRDFSKNQNKILNRFSTYLRGRRYSESTISVYTFFIAELVHFHKNKLLKNLTNRNVEEFIEKVFVTRGYSISSQ